MVGDFGGFEMKRALVGLVLALGLASVPGCGSDDDSSSPMSDCKSFYSAMCAKFYGCFTKDELAPFAEIVGNNEADCRTKWQGENCTTEKVKCDSGETYDPSAAKECISQFKSLSCDEFSSDTAATPAACDQFCK